MATVWIEFFHDTQEVALGYPDSRAKLTLGPASVATAANTLRHDGRFRIVADDLFYFEVGAEPVATTSTSILPSGVIEYRFIKAGHKVAVKDTS